MILAVICIVGPLVVIVAYAYWTGVVVKRALEQYHKVKTVKGETGMGYDILTWRYWNSNGIGIAIVAVRGCIGDWAAYIGAERSGRREMDAVDAAAEYGSKLGEKLARAVFPQITGHYRR